MSINCEKCSAQNRDIARYCKKCGEELITGDAVGLEQIVGLKSVKSEITSMVNISKALKMRTTGGSTQRINMHTILVGNSGTGKSLLAGVLQNLFYENGLISKKNIELVDAVDFENYMEEFEENIKKAKGGILFIDNVQKLVPDGYAKDIQKIDKLFSEMDKFGSDPIVVLAGLPGGLEEFLDNNPSIRNRFKTIVTLPNFNLPELLEITRRNLKKYNLKLNEDSEARLKGLIKYAVKHKTSTSGNGHYAVNVAEDIFKAYLSRISKGETDDNIVKPSDIIGEVEIEKSFDEIMHELDEFIGMPAVKNAVKEIAEMIQTSKQREERGISGGMKLSMHTILTGNPGTGKTTVARKLGEVFSALGFLESGHVIEVDKSKMVSPYKNETAKIVNRLCDEAMGGILFVDEAYTLYQGSQLSGGSDNDGGKEAVETLMKRMEDDRDKFVVIAAGYKMEMDGFLKANSGIKSRIDRFLHIDDYKPNELYQIFEMFLTKKKYNLHPSTIEFAQKAIKEVYETRDKNFGNGRDMRKLFETTVSKFSQRLNTIPFAEQTEEVLTTIMPEDLPYEAPKESAVDEILVELNKLTGLKNVKTEVTSIVNYINLEKKRAEAGGKKSPLNLNFVFTGNPGTGKTTVARIMGNIFKALGLLPKGHVVEVDASKMIAGFSGQTAIKTDEKIDEALGGVFFLDEAYTLSAGGDSNNFGQQAIDQLLKRMEDDRGRFISIAAGYTNEMREFIQTNPGLQSRFTRYIEFEDFTAEELNTIMHSMVAGKGMYFDPVTEEKLGPYFINLVAGKDENFGNARTVRNIYEKALQRHSSRIAEMLNKGENVDEEMNTLRYVDIAGEEEKVKSMDEILADLDKLVGMEKVKQVCIDLAERIKMERERINRGLSKGEKVGVHMVITGNPGTGKTTVARKLGEVFKSIGFLSRGNVVEVDRSGMVSKYPDETPELVNKQCNKAMGGILFVDEAYTLTPASDTGDKDASGLKAVETLMKRMEDDRGRFVVIAAGYKDEMENFLDANPGMKSRFDKYLHLDDYNVDQLYEIFVKGFASRKNYKVAPEAEPVLFKAIQQIYDKKDKNFANAREMRRLFDEVSTNLSTALSSKNFDELTDDDYTTIRPEYVPYDAEADKEKSIEEIMGELNELIGLDNIKNEIRDITNYLRVDKKRRELGHVTGKPPVFHFVFKGNPGTGKTTVARIIADVFKTLKLLPKGQVIETDRSDLVGTHIGHTEPKTNKAIDKSIGGIFFIDEAYTLSGRGGNDYGKEAIEVLLKRMEDDRGKFICVVAGYTNEMDHFLETNPGLQSRFNRTIMFEDYTPDQLMAIFKLLVNKRKLKLGEGLEEFLMERFTYLFNNRDKNFGNARLVRNTFEKAVQKQGSRLAELIDSPDFNADDLETLKIEDVEL